MRFESLWVNQAETGMDANGDRVFFVSDHQGHCGDNICCLSAAIEFAERIDGTVYVDFFEDVVKAYNHPRLKFGKRGIQLHVLAAHKHRNKAPGFLKNILGTYYAEFGLPIGSPELRLPRFEPCEPRALIQPESVFACNPPGGYVQGIVDEFVGVTGRTLYAIGNRKTPTTLRNVDYSLLADSVPFFMRQVQSAICVLTPRSFAANLAAGYHVPAFMWSPMDGEDWHIDYEGWRGVKCNFGRKPDLTQMFLRSFIDDFGLRKAFDVQLGRASTEDKVEEAKVCRDGDGSKQDSGVEQRVEAD